MRSQIPSQNRILLASQEISGYYKNLETGLIAIGIETRLVTTHPHPFDYGQATPNPYLAKVASAAVMKHRKSGKFPRLIWATIYLFFSLLLVFWAIPRFDIFVFSWGTSFLPWNLDIPIYRMFGKKVFVVLGHGSEARPPYMSTPPYTEYPKTQKEVFELQKQVNRVARSVRRNERFANRVIGMQMTAQFLTRPFIDFYRIGLPSPAISEKTFIDSSEKRSQKIEILHVPSNKSVKGTTEIRKAVQSALKSHQNVNYRELSGVSHNEIIHAMSHADIILDWLWSDIPMAVVGTEAASLSKPTIISSFGWKQWERWEGIHGKDLLPPVIRATPETLEQVIRSAVSDFEKSKCTGLKAKEFISKKWTPSQVAVNFLTAISEEVPETWIMSPSEVDYLWGAGVSKENTLAMVQALLRTGKSNPLRWASGEAMYRDYLLNPQDPQGAN